MCFSGSALLIYWGFDRSRYHSQVGIWFGLLGFLLVICLSDVRRALTMLRSTHFLWLIPLSVAAVTIGYRLSQIPTNCHFDFNYYVYAAQQLMQGKMESIWKNGFVPAPVIGLVPEMFGLSVGGANSFGFRLGAALFGLSGILAVYLLAREYRDRKTALCAALFLAGNIPYIHFSRVASNGTSTTTALWVITLFVLALRYGHLSLWILTGIASGYCFYLWPVARVGVVVIGLFGILLAARYPRVVISRWYGPAFLVAAFLVMIAPLIPIWITTPILFFPRVEESVTVFKVGRGFFHDVLLGTFGEPFWKSFAWFFGLRDNSSQGTIPPGFNTIESVLFACGLAIFLFEGWSLNVLFVILLVVTLVTCGAWADVPPWYTRLLPTAPIAAIAMARSIAALHDFSYRFSTRVASAMLVLTSAFVIGISPVMNFRRYVNYETGGSGDYQMWEMVAIGRSIEALGPDFDYFLVTTKSADWGINFSARFGELLPFVFPLRISEVRDLPEHLAKGGIGRAAFVIQAARWQEDYAVIRASYPAAFDTPIKGFNDELLAVLVVVEGPR